MELKDEIAKASISLIAELAKSLFAAGVNKSKDEIQKLSVQYGNAFKKYIERTNKRFQKVKTILDPSLPVAFSSIYEPPCFVIGETKYDQEEFIDHLISEKFTVITGLGGSGKSIFLRYLFLHSLHFGQGRIPVFIELRTLTPGETIEAAIQAQLNVKANIDAVGLKHILSLGKILLLLDGYDEIEEENRQAITSQILALSVTYDENIFVITSRPRDEFVSWQEFYVATIEPFTKEQVVSLISKLKYEKEGKKTFLLAIENDLYDTHSSYLSNPLLCIIMLMTFDQGAGIPEKQHLFFELAFEVLFYKHDATKTGYFRRPFATKLTIDQFRNVFGTFSAFSYVGKGSSFMRSDAADFAKLALSYDDCGKDSEDLLTDLTERMCLLIKEGSRYSYIHRTFQEYFSAYFLANRSFDGWQDVIHQIVKEKPNDNVIQMLYDMTPAKFEKYYLLEKLNALLKAVDALNIIQNPRDFCKLYYLGFSLTKETKKVFSWTFGVRNTFAEYDYLFRIMSELPEVSELNIKFEEEQDWSNFLKIARYAETLSYYEFEFDSLSKASILKSPIFQYFKDFTEICRRKKIAIEESQLKRERLVATTIMAKLTKG